MSANLYELELYVTDQCVACTIAVEFIEENKIECRVVHLVSGARDQGEANILVFPALIKSGNLIAYGKDIIGYFKKRFSTDIELTK